MPGMGMFMAAYLLGLAVVVGAVLGSFINCLAVRWGKGEGIAKGRSHCVECGHTLAAGDLVPVFGWLFLRGRCRYCGAGISARYLTVEVFMALLSVLCLLRFGITAGYVKAMGFFCILLAEGLIDFDTYEIPDVFHGAALGWWGIFLLIQKTPFFHGLLQGLLDGLWVAGGLLVLALIGDRITGKETMGGGDIKMFFVAGMYLGWEVNLLNLIASCVLGIGFGLLTKKSRIPFGPAIGVSTCFCMLAGAPLVERYLGLFGGI